MKLYNTLTKRIEEFQPLDPPLVRLYLCGITPYDKSHVGHLRVYVITDILRRLLRKLGYIDIAVTNFTDIDDKIIRKSKELNKDWKAIAEENIEYFFNVIEKLNILPYNIYPRVTYHINEIAEAVYTLLWRGFAYKGKYSIYYEVDKYPHYGQLSGVKEREQWNQELDFVEDKKKPYDFALWKFKKEGEPYWKTIVGEGRPGWHIECSVMSSRYLGEQFDIHLGGTDLIFPHHENEIAQSEALYMVRPWVKYWVHIGMVKIEGEKMSKSLGNIIPAHEFIEDLTPMVVRFFLASAQYRKPLDITKENIEQAKKNYEYLTKTIKTLISSIRGCSFYADNDDLEVFRKLVDLHKQFILALTNDLDTPKAISYLMKAARIVNNYIVDRDSYIVLITAYNLFKDANDVFALWDDIFYGKTSQQTIENALIDLIVEVRKQLRNQKNFELADKIRDELRKLGIELLDKGNETIWRKI